MGTAEDAQRRSVVYLDIQANGEERVRAVAGTNVYSANRLGVVITRESYRDNRGYDRAHSVVKVLIPWHRIVELEYFGQDDIVDRATRPDIVAATPTGRLSL